MPLSRQNILYSSYTRFNNSSTCCTAVRYPSGLVQEMQSWSGSWLSFWPAPSKYPEPMPLKRSLASDILTMRFMLAPLAPIMRRATWKSLSLSMPMRNRHVYFLTPLVCGDLSAPMPPATAPPGAKGVPAGAAPASAGATPAGGKPHNGIGGYGGVGNAPAPCDNHVMRRVPSNPLSTFPFKSVIAAWASWSALKVITALVPASSTRIVLTLP
mmetsp:Transcript_118250/g.339247  ORF Transcript_118250/g.339247 Transcript_118250/m.339247 type:complete len:213 (-) Transcript_118250:530-1168(-)